MNDRNLSKDSTVYTYKLLKRVRCPAVIQYLYAALLFGAAAYNVVRLEPFVLPTAFLIMIVIHELLLRLLFRMTVIRSPKLWAFRLRLPWIGLVPHTYYSISSFHKANLQLFWVPMLLIGCSYVWLPLELTLHLIAAHLWILGPRFLTVYRFRKHFRDGLIKINPTDVSCYAQ